MKQKTLRSTLVYFGLLVILTIPLCLGLFGSNLISAHDSLAGLIRALSMDRYMGHGQFLVRWAPEVNWGYGYPMFNFYPPFFSFVSVLFYHLTQNMVLAINWASVLFWVLSGFGMFLFAREYWGNEGGMLSAVLYVYAPYHIADLYVRGAFAEFSSFAFFPFILFAILKMCRKPGLGGFLIGVGSVFGLSLSHNIMSMLFFPTAGVYMLYLFIFEKRSAWILPTAGIFVIGLMMSSFFWLPALVEKTSLNLRFLTSMRYDYHNYFISLGNLFWPFDNFSQDGISFQVGIIYTLLCVGTLVGLFKIFKISKQSGLGYVFFLIMGVLAIFFTLPYSCAFWEHINFLSYIQFPWRFLAIIVFALSFLCGSVAILIKNPLLRKIFLIIAGLLAIFISLRSMPKPTYISNNQGIEEFLAMGEGEYTPKWVIIAPDGLPDRKFEIFNGQGRLGEEKVINPVCFKTKFQALGVSQLYFNAFYFPGWHVYIDGQPTEPHLDNPYGLILFNVLPGNHDIQVVFGTTPARIAGMIISWIGVVLLLGGVLVFKFIKTRLKLF